MTESILYTIGHTPLVRLTRVYPDCPFRLFAKLEGFNPGGSAKDRPALHILQKAMRTGAVKSGTVVIESSSGNLGIGLAQACRYLGLRFICVVDPKTTAQNIRILKVYGAEIDLVAEPDPVTGEFLQARINRVQTLLQTIEDSFWTNQYANPLNAQAHYSTTMSEIATELDGRIDYLFVSTSTCGTLRGCAEYVRDHRMRTIQRLFERGAHSSLLPAKSEAFLRFLSTVGSLPLADFWRRFLGCVRQFSDELCLFAISHTFHHLPDQHVEHASGECQHSSSLELSPR